MKPSRRGMSYHGGKDKKKMHANHTLLSPTQQQADAAEIISLMHLQTVRDNRARRRRLMRTLHTIEKSGVDDRLLSTAAALHRNALIDRLCRAERDGDKQQVDNLCILLRDLSKLMRGAGHE